MSIAIGEDHLALRETARRFTADRCAPAVARAAMDADAESLPPFWAELAELGWLGLAVAEADGGQGFGYAELAVVLEELGRTVAPGPMLPTAWAAAVIAEGARDGPASDLLHDLACGRRAGTVSLGGAIQATPMSGGAGRLCLRGTAGPVLCGLIADVVVVPVTINGDERWAVLAGA
ncbi:MAG: acyl-CoA dehydrogenase family protein, partial [Acidimicrobiales bacterium]